MKGSFNIYKPSDTIDDMELCKTQPCFALEKVTGLCTVVESTHSHLHVYQKVRQYYCSEAIDILSGPIQVLA